MNERRILKKTWEECENKENNSKKTKRKKSERRRKRRRTQKQKGNYVRNEKYKRINQKTNMGGIEEERNIRIRNIKKY